jgi:glutamate synthase (NADPH/NADH) large chain
VLDVPADSVVAKGRLQPGRMFLVDTAQGRIVEDDEVKAELAAEHPYADWLHAGSSRSPTCPSASTSCTGHESVLRRQQVFGYTEEELRILIAPMAKSGAEAIGSMGTDTPVAVLSQRPRLLFDYFSQLFAQVTNPPLDAIREELVTSLAGSIGRSRTCSSRRPPPAGRSCCRSRCSPTTTSQDRARQRGRRPAGFSSVTVHGLYPVNGGARRCATRSTGSAARCPRHRRRRPAHRAVRPRLHRAHGADPVAAAHLGGAPPPHPREDPHPGRPGRRGR